MDKLILASGSPRRKELLKNAGYSFDIEVSNEDENTEEMSPSKTVTTLSKIKAESILKKHMPLEDGRLFILGADTVVSVDGLILGKPESKNDAVRMIKLITGRSHEVYTGVTLCMLYPDGSVKERAFSALSKVFVVPMTTEEINEYIETGESMDAAGAYKIQGMFGKYISGFEGERENIIGLPIAEVIKVLEEEGYSG